MDCPACGNEVRSDSIFCHHCGVNLESVLASRRIWLCANALGLAIGLEVTWLLTFGVPTTGFFSPSPESWGLIGLSIGLAQLWALKKLNYALDRQWVFVTAFALLAGIILSTPLTFITGLIFLGVSGQGSPDLGMSFASTGCMAGFVAALVAGGLVGFAQSRLLPNKIAANRRWIKLNMVGWAIAGAMFGAVELWLSVGLHLRWGESAVWLFVLPPVGLMGGLISGRITFSALSTQTTSVVETSKVVSN